MVRAKEPFQLVVRVMVTDLSRSLEFYRALGFEERSREGDFAVLSWDRQQLLFLGEDRPSGRSVSTKITANRQQLRTSNLRHNINHEPRVTMAG